MADYGFLKCGEDWCKGRRGTSREEMGQEEGMKQPRARAPGTRQQEQAAGEGTVCGQRP